ncbi:THO complex subunit 7/Mft1 [Cinara cedri]|uniref:THO complex subunit 7/Mft1 n=1 Tax=Cinara cedri TaxID=506608 RepID=A0A5E4MMS3_9HEMI|nr:THO complex subunit 7/Mft1 [Cinara cedri]
MWYWKMMLRVSWIEHCTNESILNEIDEGREILKTIRARRWNIIGHILRHENELIYRIIEEEVIARKLLNDGDGIGDDRRLNLLLKSFLKWCDTDYNNLVESDIAQEKIINHLNLCEHAMKKSKGISERHDKEIETYENISKEIDLETANILSNINETKAVLKEVKTNKRNKMECDLLIQHINKFQPRAKSAKCLEELTNEVQDLIATKDEITKKIDKLKIPLDIILDSINVLTESLEETIENSSIGENMSSYEPIDDDEDLEILNRKYEEPM